MPRPDALADLEIEFSNGYYPSAAALAPEQLQRTIRRGESVWLRPNGRIEVAKGTTGVSVTNVGARLFAVDISRASIEGGLVSNRLPYAGIIRYLNAVLLYLSESVSAQVYLNETAVSGLTTSATAGRLRVAVPAGGGTYSVFDAGFDKPGIGTVTTATGGTKAMTGRTGTAIAPWRTTTNAIGPPSEVTYNDLTPTTADLIKNQFPSPASGQDGWIFCGTRWGDQSGELRVVRYVYLTPRGTFTATNGSPNLTAGIGTFWNRDLRAGDIVTIDAASYTISAVTSNTTATLTANFGGSTAAGKTMLITTAAADWYDSELGALIDRDAIRPPRAAGVFEYANRVFLWGVKGESSSSATGPAILVCLKNNPEHVGLDAISTASGSDLVNVLVGDRQLYLMTTTGLEVVTFTGREEEPYIVREIAQPGFRSGTCGVIYKDFFYGFNRRPLRTRVDENIDVNFAARVWSDMQDWDPLRVLVAVDPKNEAVLFIYDNLSSTTVIPYMTQLGVWGPPFTTGNRYFDSAVVDGELYITQISLGNIRVIQWEGSTGQSGAYVASQYYDANLLMRSRLKNLQFAGKGTTLRVYAQPPDAAIPDVSDGGASAANFALSGSEKDEAEIFTNIEGRAFAFRVDLPTTGTIQKIIARGMPRSERR